MPYIQRWCAISSPHGLAYALAEPIVVASLKTWGYPASKTPLKEPSWSWLKMLACFGCCAAVLANTWSYHTHTHTHRAVLQPMKQNRIKPGNSLNAQPTQPKSTQGLLVKWLPPGRRRWRWRRWRRWWRWKCTKKFVFPCRGRRNWRCWLHWSWHWSWWVHHQGNFTRNIRHRLQSVQRGVRCYRCHRCDRTMRWQVLRVLVQVIQLHWVVHTFVLAKMAVRMHLVIHGDKWYKRFYIGLQHPRSFWLWQCWPIGFRSAPLTLLFCALPFCELPSVPFNPMHFVVLHSFTISAAYPWQPVLYLNYTIFTFPHVSVFQHGTIPGLGSVNPLIFDGPATCHPRISRRYEHMCNHWHVQKRCVFSHSNFLILWVIRFSVCGLAPRLRAVLWPYDI